VVLNRLLSVGYGSGNVGLIGGVYDLGNFRTSIAIKKLFVQKVNSFNTYLQVDGRPNSRKNLITDGFQKPEDRPAQFTADDYTVGRGRNERARTDPC